MNPREFCKIAGRLAAQGEAAACRSAISRAYYSLFHVILEFLLSRDDTSSQEEGGMSRENLSTYVQQR